MTIKNLTRNDRPAVPNLFKNRKPSDTNPKKCTDDWKRPGPITESHIRVTEEGES